MILTTKSKLFGNRHKEGDTVHLPFKESTLSAAISVTPIEMCTMFMTPALARVSESDGRPSSSRLQVGVNGCLGAVVDAGSLHIEHFVVVEDNGEQDHTKANRTNKDTTEQKFTG